MLQRPEASAGKPLSGTHEESTETEAGTSYRGSGCKDQKPCSIDSYHRAHDGVRNPSGSSRKYSLCQLNHLSCALLHFRTVVYYSACDR